MTDAIFSSLYLVCIAPRDVGDRRSISTVLLLLLLLSKLSIYIVYEQNCAVMLLEG